MLRCSQRFRIVKTYSANCDKITIAFIDDTSMKKLDHENKAGEPNGKS